MVSVEGENMRGVTWVKIFEVNSGEWGVGGKPLRPLRNWLQVDGRGEPFFCGA